MQKAANLMYRLGGLINIYDHIGDPDPFFATDGKPTAVEFEQYIMYAQSLRYVWTTNTVGIDNWWRRRDHVRVSHSYTKKPLQVTVVLSCITDPGPFSVDVKLPWVGPVDVSINRVRTSDYVLGGSNIRVSAPAPATVVITKR